MARLRRAALIVTLVGLAGCRLVAGFAPAAEGVGAASERDAASVERILPTDRGMDGSGDAADAGLDGSRGSSDVGQDTRAWEDANRDQLARDSVPQPDLRDPSRDYAPRCFAQGTLVRVSLATLVERLKQITLSCCGALGVDGGGCPAALSEAGPPSALDAGAGPPLDGAIRTTSDGAIASTGAAAIEAGAAKPLSKTAIAFDTEPPGILIVDAWALYAQGIPFDSGSGASSDGPLNSEIAASWLQCAPAVLLMFRPRLCGEPDGWREGGILIRGATYSATPGRETLSLPKGLVRGDLNIIDMLWDGTFESDIFGAEDNETPAVELAPFRPITEAIASALVELAR